MVKHRNTKFIIRNLNPPPFSIPLVLLTSSESILREAFSKFAEWICLTAIKKNKQKETNRNKIQKNIIT